MPASRLQLLSARVSVDCANIRTTITGEMMMASGGKVRLRNSVTVIPQRA